MSTNTTSLFHLCEKPIEITRHNWIIGNYIDEDKSIYYELHYCNNDYYKGGLLIDDVWSNTLQKVNTNKKVDIYVLSAECCGYADFTMNEKYCYFLNCKNIEKQFIWQKDLDSESLQRIASVCNNLKSKYSNKSGKPIITVVTTVYNNALLLEQTIQSVINQNVDGLEYIIKDADSKDEFDEVVGRYSNYGIKVIKSKDKGIYDGMDQGVKAASGEYFQVLNSDDLFYGSDITRKYIDEIKSNHEDAYCSDMNIKFPNGKSIRRIADLSKLRYRSCVNHPSLVMKLSDYKRLGGFDLGLSISADCDLTIKMVKAKVKIKHLEFLSVNFRAEGASNSVYTLKILKENLICRYRYSQFNIPGYCYTILQFLKIRLRQL